MLHLVADYKGNVTSVDQISLDCMKQEGHPILALEGWARAVFIITMAIILLVELFAKSIIIRHIMESKFKERPINILLMADRVHCVSKHSARNQDLSMTLCYR